MIAMRPVEPADVPALLEITLEGFETYRAFAPPDWELPELRHEQIVAIEDVATWIVADGEDGAPVGHVLLIPASRSAAPVDDPKLGHLMQLFVRRTHWGTEVARVLHAAVLEDAARRGFEEVRLFTPTGQGRARRFYEREGWREVATVDETPLGFPIVEYRIACPTPS